MKYDWILGVAIFAMITGCSPTEEIASPPTISSIVISTEASSTLQVVRDVELISQFDQFLTNHEGEWGIPVSESVEMFDSALLYLLSGESFDIGYSSNVLIRAKPGHYRFQYVDPSEIDALKELLAETRASAGK